MSLDTLKKSAASPESGFTLIELLVVVLVIGILAAIAVPAFLNQRGSAVEATVQSDLKNLGVEMETIMLKTGKYPDSLPGNFKASDGNVFKLEAEAGSTNIAAGLDANSSAVRPGRVSYHIGAASADGVKFKRTNTEGTATYSENSNGGPYWDYDPEEPIPTGTTLSGSLEVKSNRDMCTRLRFEQRVPTGERINDVGSTDPGCLTAGQWKELTLTYTTGQPLNMVTLTAYGPHEPGDVFEFRNPVIVFGGEIKKGNVDVAVHQKFCVEGHNTSFSDRVWHYTALGGGVKEGKCSG